MSHPTRVPPTSLRAQAYESFQQQIVEANIRPGQFISQRELMQLLPLDTFTQDPARTMAVVGDNAAVPPPVAEFQTTLAQADEATAHSMERHAFYAQAGACFAIFRTGELRKYGNILLRKGVLASD